MKLKERIKSYSFWVSLASAIFLILQIAGQKFGFKVDESLFNDLFTSMCSILVILGIIAPPTAKSNTQISSNNLLINNESTNELFSNNLICDSDEKPEKEQMLTENTLPTAQCTESNNVATKTEVICSDLCDKTEPCDACLDTKTQLISDDLITNTTNVEVEQIIEPTEMTESTNFSSEEICVQNIDAENEQTLNAENAQINENELVNLLNQEQAKFAGNNEKFIQLLQEQIAKLSVTKSE